MVDIKERNKGVKRILSKVFGVGNVSVTGGKGTGYGWCHIALKAKAPCQEVINCRECADQNNNVCKANKNPIRGGWGDSARQILTDETEKKANEAIKQCDFYSYADYGGSRQTDIQVRGGGGQGIIQGRQMQAAPGNPGQRVYNTKESGVTG